MEATEETRLTWRRSAGFTGEDAGPVQPTSETVLHSTNDVKLLRSEIASLNARLQRLNVENDDLLERLGEAQRTRQPGRPPRDDDGQLVAQNESLRRRVAELQQEADDGTRTQRHTDLPHQTDVYELRQQLTAERHQHQTNQNVLRLEIEGFQQTVNSLTQQLADAKNENKSIVSNSEREHQLESRVVELMTSLGEETKNRQALIKEHQTEVQELTQRERELIARNDELKQLLDREEKRRLDASREAQEHQRAFTDKELAYQSEVDELKGAVAELKSRVEVLTSSVETKERIFEEVMQEKAALAVSKEDLQSKASYKEVQLQSQIDGLTSTISDKGREIEEVNWKMRDLRNVKEHMEMKEKDLERSLNEARTKNHEAEEKNRKLERAVVRLKLDNERVTSQLNDQLLGADENLKNLLREQEAHIADLRAEVGTLRTTLKDLSKKDATKDRRQRTLTDKLATAMEQQVAVDELESNSSGGESEARRQLEVARRRLDASTKRVAQLERWLDEIYNDRELGLGPRLAARHHEVAVAVTAGAGRSTFRSQSTDHKRSARGVTLPGLRDGGDLSRPRARRSRHDVIERSEGKRVWDNRTKPVR